MMIKAEEQSCSAACFCEVVIHAKASDGTSAWMPHKTLIAPLSKAETTLDVSLSIEHNNTCMILQTSKQRSFLASAAHAPSLALLCALVRRCNHPFMVAISLWLCVIALVCTVCLHHAHRLTCTVAAEREGKRGRIMRREEGVKQEAERMMTERDDE